LNLGYRILKDPRGDTLGRGTEITLTIKDDAAEFLKTDKLKEIIKKHSEFVNFPIYLWVGEIIEDKNENPDDESDDSDEEVVVEDVNDSPTQPKYKTVHDWKLINENKPIWKRDPKDLTPEDYEEFSKKHYGDHQKPLAYSHFKLEGDAEFTCLVFVPSRAPSNFLKPEATQNSFVELYVKKVLIAENLRDLLPQWLNFLKIVIDSDDLPLNVSRETVQNHASIKKIKKKLISKSLDMFEEIAKRDNDDYSKFFREYGKGLKYGLYESRSSHEKKLLELMRFPTTTDKFSSLEAYVGRMKEGQPQIYYSASENSPYADAVTDKGYEIILMLDPTDEYLAKDRIKKYKDIPVQDIDKSGVKLGEDDVTEESMKSLEEKFEPLTNFLFQKLYDKVSKVSLNTKLSKTAGAVVPGLRGISPYQEKVVKIQNAGKELDYSASFYLKQKKIFEINPNHPLIIKMLQLVEEEDFDSLKSISTILYGNSAIGSGWEIDKPKELSIRIEKLLRKYLGAAEGMEEDDVVPEDVEEPDPLIADTEDNLIKSYMPSDDEDHPEL
jgi:heat shock protein beta